MQNGRYLGAGDYVSHLSESAAQDLGLPTSVAVASGVIDAYAGWVGTVGATLSSVSHDAPSARSDISEAFTRLAAVAGTSTCHLAMSAKAVFVEGVWGPYRDVLLPNYWMAEGGQSATGLLLSHVIETHPAHSEALEKAKAANQNIYGYLNLLLEDMAKNEKAPGGNISWLGRHLFFYGDFFGNRSPIADPNMRGAIAGLSSDTSVDALALLYYGAMESIALQTRQIVERMNDSGHSIQSIFMSGSQCQNEILMQLISTACGMPVVIPRYVHAAVVCGAAMLGVRAASCQNGGDGEGLWSIMSRMTKVGRTVEPSTDRLVVELLEAKHRIFLEQCASQSRWRKEVDDALNASLKVERN
jgi:FGGY-family pentulose kinase